MSKRSFDKPGPAPGSLPLFAHSSSIVAAAKGSSFIELVAATMHVAAGGKANGPGAAYGLDIDRQKALLTFEGSRLLAHAKEQIEIAAAQGHLTTKLCELRLPNRHALGKVMAGPIVITRDEAKRPGSDAAKAHMAIWSLVSNANTARICFAAQLGILLGPGLSVTFHADERQPDLCTSIYLHWLGAILKT